MTTNAATVDNEPTPIRPAKAAPKAAAKPAVKAAAKATPKVKAAKFEIRNANGSPVEHPVLSDRKHARQVIRRLSVGKTLVLVDSSGAEATKTTYTDGGQA